MAGWPSNWITRTLESADIPNGEETRAIMRAWQKSTPLPPYTNNPLGMPASFGGKVRYMDTGYAMFQSMSDFYATFARFIETYAGNGVREAMTSHRPYSATWRAVSQLAWPGSVTETDYPSALLDLTSASYRERVGATPKDQRKTSGTVGRDVANGARVLAETRSMVQAQNTIKNTAKLVNLMIRKHAHG